jgi:hypothetical protein
MAQPGGFGLWLAVMSGAWTQGWLHAKLVLVLVLSGLYGNPFIDRADSWRNARLTDEGYWVLRFHAWPTCLAELIFDPQENLKSPDGIRYERFTRDYGSAFHIRSDVVSRLSCE